MIKKAYGKINLSIDVVNKREDGYHNLDMIMLPIDLYDVVEMNLSHRDSYQCNVDLPYDKGNIIYKCVELMRDQFKLNRHFSIRVEKNIPANAGLAGGSADGAVVLQMINELCGLHLTNQQLIDLGKKIGADIPFCLFAQPARVQGIGERIRFIELKEELDVLLIKPEQGIPTPQAFKMLDLQKCEHPDMDELEKAFISGEKFAHLLGNSLQYSGFEINSEVQSIIERCKEKGFANTLMTGSGSTVFVIDKKDNLQDLQKQLGNDYPFVYLTKILMKYE